MNRHVTIHIAGDIQDSFGRTMRNENIDFIWNGLPYSIKSFSFSHVRPVEELGSERSSEKRDILYLNLRVNKKMDVWILVRLNNPFFDSSRMIAGYKDLVRYLQVRVPIEKLSSFRFIKPLVTAFGFVSTMDNGVDVGRDPQQCMMCVRIRNEPATHEVNPDGEIRLGDRVKSFEQRVLFDE